MEGGIVHRGGVPSSRANEFAAMRTRCRPSPTGPVREECRVVGRVPSASCTGAGSQRGAGWAPLRSTPAIRRSGAGTVLRIAIRWMMCHGRHPPPPPLILPLRKNADGRPLAGSSLSTKGLMHPADRRLLRRSASGRRDDDHPVRPPSQRPPVRRRCDATAGRESAEYRGRPEILGTAAAAGEGTASAFFVGDDTHRMVRMSAQAPHPPDRDQ